MLVNLQADYHKFLRGPNLFLIFRVNFVLFQVDARASGDGSTNER